MRRDQGHSLKPIGTPKGRFHINPTIWAPGSKINTLWFLGDHNQRVPHRGKIGIGPFGARAYLVPRGISHWGQEVFWAPERGFWGPTPLFSPKGVTRIQSPKARWDPSFWGFTQRRLGLEKGKNWGLPLGAKVNIGAPPCGHKLNPRGKTWGGNERLNAW